MFKLWRRRQLELAPANVDAAWLNGDTWRGWDPPRNVVAGESHYRKQLRALTGKPRDAGYLIPAPVTIVREASNPYDCNAFRVEVAGEHVGYLARPIAAQLAAVCDDARCATFTVCGILRGGSTRARDVGVHVWLDRRLTPAPEILFGPELGFDVVWPPRGDEGVHCSADDEHT